jgi:putative protein-disulfide isomerase
MTAKLIYGFDPLCGWCFGFGPALGQIRTELTDLPIVLRMGGLVTRDRIGPYAEGAAYIENASARMKAVTGVSLGAAFHARILGDPTVISSSIPPCDAILQVRASHPAHELDFAIAIQRAHFTDGRDLNDPETYADVAERLGLYLNIVLPDPKVETPALAKEFRESRRLGLTSFPSLRLDVEGRIEGVDVSYDPGAMVALIRDALARHR